MIFNLFVDFREDIIDFIQLKYQIKNISLPLLNFCSALAQNRINMHEN